MEGNRNECVSCGNWITKGYCARHVRRCREGGGDGAGLGEIEHWLVRLEGV